MNNEAFIEKREKKYFKIKLQSHLEGSHRNVSFLDGWPEALAQWLNKQFIALWSGVRIQLPGQRK